jgi:magnesium-transporting ATPase (P-type)
MLSGESTPLLKESIELREGSDILDMNGSDRNNVLFSGTKAIQVEKPMEEGGIHSTSHHLSTADKQHLMKDVSLSY